jgi:hypothetical protein
MKGLNLSEGFPRQMMTSTKTQIDGRPALEVTVDMGLADQPEALKKMMQAYFGPGGKMVLTTVALDNNTLLMRYTSAAETKQFLTTYKSQQDRLSQNPDVVKTTQLLPQGTQWFMLLSPRGNLAFANRLLGAMPLEAVPEAGPLRLPEFAKTPPIGVGVRLSAEAIEGRLVIPAAVIDNIGPFIQQIVARKGATGPAN